MKSKGKPRNKAFDQVKGCVVLVAVVVIGIMAVQNATPPPAPPRVQGGGQEATVTPVLPTLEIRAAEGVTQEPDIFVIEPVTYYAESEVRVRECPQTDCDTLGTVPRGTALVADALMNGDEVQTGNVVWYRVAYNGGTAWVYSGVMQLTNPAAVRAVPQSTVQQIPHNCDEARAMGLNEYQAAQINSRLDRDNDGKACYDDK